MRHTLSPDDRATLLKEVKELRSDLKTATGDQAEHLEGMLDDRLATLKDGFVDSFAVERVDW